MAGTNKTTAAPTNQTEPVTRAAMAAMMPKAKSTVPSIDLRRIWLFGLLSIGTTDIVARSHDLCAAGSHLQCFAHVLCDHGGIVVHLEHYGALESVRPGNQYLVPAPERVGHDPRFVRAGAALLSRRDGRLDALSAMTPIANLETA